MGLVIAAIVTKIALAGSGCKAQDKVEAHFNEDSSELSVDVPAFRTQMRANCDVVLTIKHDAGVQMLPKTVQVDWSARLAKGATTDIGFNYHYQGRPETPAGHLLVKDEGAIASRHEVIAVDKPVASECGTETTLVLAVSALVRGPDSTVEVTKVSPFGIAWRACKA